MQQQTQPQYSFSALDIMAAAFSELQELAAECRIDWHRLQSQLPEPGCPIQGKQVPVLQQKDAYRCFFVWHVNKTTRGQEYPIVVFFTHATGGIQINFNGYVWLTSNQDLAAHWARIGSADQHIPKLIAKADHRYSQKDSSKRFDSARALYESLGECTPDNAYLNHKVPDWKSFSSRDLGIRQGTDKLGNYIMVPLQNHANGVTGFQKIYDRDLPFTQGDKWTIGRKKGSWFAIQGRPSPLVITEGLTTGLSIHMASRASVLVAIDAGNLLEVVKAWPDTSLVIAADNDYRESKGINPGMAYAKKAASNRKNVRVILPMFGQASAGKFFSDFNDLHNIVGTKRFQEMMQKPLSMRAKHEAFTFVRV